MASGWPNPGASLPDHLRSLLWRSKAAAAAGRSYPTIWGAVSPGVAEGSTGWSLKSGSTVPSHLSHKWGASIPSSWREGQFPAGTPGLTEDASPPRVWTFLSTPGQVTPPTKARGYLWEEAGLPSRCQKVQLLNLFSWHGGGWHGLHPLLHPRSQQKHLKAGFLRQSTHSG